ncbi:MAG: Fe-S cluster assembly ATPase SufC [Alphaproteobacteria bacterium]|nr:Fe-S cluster assembly ATPase SufC [Alphaproteobacteria bacterium]NDC56328.1 Fe-S cluster assembly ATPase SufC [Alphaproteobacteria bacterium]NDG04157.1 Fe-S cluster assembly ATPase SufC [Alphaproteobacteria bacterium]
MLEITNLHASIDGKSILQGYNLSLPAGQVHAIMGPNGSGKSTLSYVLAGRDGYDITEGDVQLNGETLLPLAPEERAARGLFLGMQYPVEIPGVSNMVFLKTALNAQRRAKGMNELDAVEFLQNIKTAAQQLGLSDDMLKRSVNTGFSGGEKKRNEMLQMLMLQPTCAVLDETDSGLDVDALKVIANAINAMRAPTRSFLIITHYQRLLDYVKPDVVHIQAHGKIVATGGPELAHKLEAEGYKAFGIEQAA